MNNELFKKYNKIKYIKLLFAIMIDLVGLVSYGIPAIGESIDFVWAPISGLLIFVLFPNHKLMALAGVAEEFIPFTDFVPTASIAWIFEYVKDDKRAQADFEKRFEKSRFYEQQ